MSNAPRNNGATGDAPEQLQDPRERYRGLDISDVQTLTIRRGFLTLPALRKIFANRAVPLSVLSIDAEELLDPSDINFLMRDIQELEQFLASEAFAKLHQRVQATVRNHLDERRGNLEHLKNPSSRTGKLAIPADAVAYSAANYDAATYNAQTHDPDATPRSVASIRANPVYAPRANPTTLAETLREKLRKLFT